MFGYVYKGKFQCGLAPQVKSSEIKQVLESNMLYLLLILVNIKSSILFT